VRRIVGRCPPLREAFFDEPATLGRNLMPLTGPLYDSAPTLRHQLGFNTYRIKTIAKPSTHTWDS